MQTLRSFFAPSLPAPNHPLSLFHHCDTSVHHQMTRLTQFIKGTTSNNLDRRSKLLKDLKDSQQNLLLVLMHMVDVVTPHMKTSRDFRAKYPDEVTIEQLYGTIWFGAECLSAGSRIANHDYESIELKPYAVRLCRCITRLRHLLRKEQYNQTFKPTRTLQQVLKDFDKSWVDFEFRYVSAMCNVQTELQLVQQQEIAVLFSETTNRALESKYFTYDQMELMDPAVMFAIPRLAIISGLVVFPEGPISPQRPLRCIAACFRPYRQLLAKIKDNLTALSEKELVMLEKALCTTEGLSFLDKPCIVPINTSTLTSGHNSHEPTALVLSPCSLNNGFSSEHLVYEPVANDELVPENENEAAGLENESETVSSMKDEPSVVEEWNESVVYSEHIEPHPSTQEVLSVSRYTLDTPLQHTLDSMTSGFTSPNDRLHKLFLAISEVADQLQTNFPHDYRSILKYVFTIHTSDDQGVSQMISKASADTVEGKKGLEDSVFSRLEFDISLSRRLHDSAHSLTGSKVEWVSDSETQVCSVCDERFSFFKRRHHCRSCGQVVCGNCSPHFLPLALHPSSKPERVCTTCYIDKLGSMASSLTAPSLEAAMAY